MATTPARDAERFGLRPMGVRPAFVPYLQQLWQRRYFIWTFARAQVDAGNSQTRLGQFWQVLNPLLNALVFFFVFGVLLQTRKGVDNYIAFLVTGVFIFTYTQKSLISGSKSIAGNLGLIRALHFPRAVLPLAATLQELLQLGISMGVLAIIVMATGEFPTWWWLLLPFALALQTLFNAGMALIIARLTARVLDVGQLLPFAIRTWLYLSGVFYSMQVFAARFPDWFQVLLYANPAAVYIELVRDLLLDSYTSPPWAWAIGAAWALLFSSFGLYYFWRAEETYGRG